MQYPESFYCPLTHEVMRDPVIDPEGISYEREAILSWLSQEQTSPVTRSALTVAQLAPNRALLDTIRQLQQMGAGDGQTVPAGPAPAAAVAPSVAVAVPEAFVSAVAAPEPQIPSTASSEGFTLSVTSRQHFKDDHSIVDTLVAVEPPNGTKASPVDIVAVVDISGSMGSEAKMMSNAGKVESHGLSLLDVVKHAVRTIAHILGPQDRLSIVTFHTKANVAIKLTKMTEDGRKRLLAVLDKLMPEDCTNIWGGLSLGLDLLADAALEKQKRVGSVVLLTDGCPNVEPPRGHIPMLKRTLQQKKEQLEHVTINTFGFGYKLDSQLLKNLATVGKGMYAFIPDSGFVGTAFVNATANILATSATNSQVVVTPINGATVIRAPGHLMPETPHEDASGATPSGTSPESRSFFLGNVQFGQPRHVVVSLRVPKASLVSPGGLPFMTAKLTARSVQNATVSLEVSANAVGEDSEVSRQLDRLEFVDTARQIIGSGPAAIGLLENLKADIQERSGPSVSPVTTALLKDITGEVTMACSEDSLWSKWGCHYLPSLACAHLMQQSNNFKDPGIQHYGGSLFQELRDRADDVFCQLPPPKASRARPSVAPVKSMRRYHCSSNVCFHGDSQVLLADGGKKAVRDVSKGDLLAVPGSLKAATVLCVVQTHCSKGEALLVALPGGLRLTPYHPVRNSKGEWAFPLDLAEPQLQSCDFVYSFVLDGGHQLSINGVTCVTLGHSFTENDVVTHAYFGSARVVDDLRKLQGWNSGVIHVQGGCLLRDSKSGVAIGFDRSAVLEAAAPSVLAQ